jgi:hypothetical protein
MGAAVSLTLSPDKLSIPLRLWSGMSVRDIQGHLEEMHGVDLISDAHPPKAAHRKFR